MSRPSDKWFHITVAAFAFVLTGVSALAIVYNKNPEQVHRWVQTVTKAPPPSKGKYNSSDSGTGQGVPQAPPVKSSDKPSPKPASTHSDRVTVEAYGDNVPPQKVAQVRRLLTEGHIVDFVSQTLRMHIQKPVHLYLAQTAADYKNALKKLGVSVEDAQRFSRDTGGFTMGEDIVIPLYQNTDQADLANSLAHELTHAYVNENVDNLPSWVNEGLAVYIGMEVQSRVQDAVTYGGYARQMAESVVEAAASNTLVPLTEDESQVLAGKAPYDLELQDWLAVSNLMKTHGVDAFTNYFHALKSGVDPAEAFWQSFGATPSQYNASFTRLLKKSASAEDKGVLLTLSVDPSFQGYIRTLQHGNSVWHGIPLTAGQYIMTLLPDGTIAEYVGRDEVTRDQDAPDRVTTYIDLEPSKPIKYHGQEVDYCGFAIDYHYGLYGFVNAWVTYKNGKSEYLEDPSLFGVKLLKVSEVSRTSPILRLITP
jgi:hypothetical protein